MTVQSTSVKQIVIGTTQILMIIMLANLFLDEVKWGIGDFAVMGVLLFSAGIAYRLIARKLSKTFHRVAVAAANSILFLLIWAELAVGIFGTPFAGS